MLVCTVIVALSSTNIALADQVEIVGSPISGGDYEIWGGPTPPSLALLYDPASMGFVPLGSATGPAVFNIPKSYEYYLVGSRSEMAIDAIRKPNGDYLLGSDDLNTGNCHRPWQFDGNGQLIGSPLDYADYSKILGAPDNLSNNVGIPPNSGTTGSVLQGYVAFKSPDTSAYGLFLGGNRLLGSQGVLNGTAAANGVANGFKNFKSWKGESIHGFSYVDDNATLKATTFQEIKAAESSLHWGDTVVFYFMGHGGGPASASSGGEAFLALNDSSTISAATSLTASELSGWFLANQGEGGQLLDKDIWGRVHKLFILDSCHSGGFWNGGLSSVSNTALLAATDAFGTTGVDPATGQGVYSELVQDAMAFSNGHTAADVNGDGLQFDELANYIRTAGSTRFADLEGKQITLLDDGLGTFHWDPYAASTPDFQLALPVPEPSMLALLILGVFPTLLATARRRR
jgi:hypothetical protein